MIKILLKVLLIVAMTLVVVKIFNGYLFYDYGEFEGRVLEIRAWSYSQPKYYYYHYNTEELDSCAYSFGIFQNLGLRKKMESRMKLTLSKNKTLAVQDTFEKLDLKHGAICNPNTPYYIYSETEDSLWVKVVTFGYRKKAVQKGKYRWGYAYKPYLKTSPPEKNKDCTRKHEIPESWDR